MSDLKLSPCLKLGVLLLGLISVPLLIIAVVAVFSAIVGPASMFTSTQLFAQNLNSILSYFIVPVIAVVFYSCGRSLNYLGSYLTMIHSSSPHKDWFKTQIITFIRELRFLLLFMGIAASSICVIHSLVRDLPMEIYLIPCIWCVIIIVAVLAEHFALKGLIPSL